MAEVRVSQLSEDYVASTGGVATYNIKTSEDYVTSTGGEPTYYVKTRPPSVLDD